MKLLKGMKESSDSMGHRRQGTQVIGSEGQSTESTNCETVI